MVKFQRGFGRKRENKPDLIEIFDEPSMGELSAGVKHAQTLGTKQSHHSDSTGFPGNTLGERAEN